MTHKALCKERLEPDNFNDFCDYMEAVIERVKEENGLCRTCTLSAVVSAVGILAKDSLSQPFDQATMIAVIGVASAYEMSPTRVTIECENGDVHNWRMAKPMRKN